MSNQREIITKFWLNGRGIGKARPRSTITDNGIHVYMPEKYRSWKDNAISDIRTQMPYVQPAPKPALIECFFINFASSDNSNLIGAVEDALVQAGYLENDSCSFLPSSKGAFAKMRKRKNQPSEMGILVHIYQGVIVTLPPDTVDEFRSKFPMLFENSYNKKVS